MFKKILLGLMLLSAAADVKAAVLKQTQHNAVEVSATETADTIMVNVKLSPKAGWQIYSHMPGEVGQPTEVEWTLFNHQLLSEKWSEGKDVIYEGFGINVYREPAYYNAVLSKAKGSMPKFKISWMACKGECVPETLFFELTPEVFATSLSTAASKETLSSTSEISAVQSENSLPQATDETWFNILLFAFLGGLVLNFMPCVFPILFIKIMSVVKQKDKSKNVKEAFEYALGVMACFALMAAVLAWLKQNGAAVGWGFQLQSPYFVASMAVLFLVLALMFLDVIKFNWSLKYMPAGSFMTGLLAVLIASPCTAPFMGAAVGWALTSERSPYFYYPVFLALGAGYALPFFLAGIYPQFLQKIMPKPGKWMNVLKKIFALPMLATCAWLVWILMGDVNKPEEIWISYRPERVENALNNGEKVLINFTAKWCITCLVNEKAVFSSKEFAKLAKKNKVRLIKADWTNHSAQIAEALAKYGRSSIPLYVYYDEGGNYKLLPQMPSLDDFKKAFSGK